MEVVKMKIYAPLKCELNQINTSETESEMTGVLIIKNLNLIPILKR